MSRQLPRIALLIETSRTYGRGILRGIARYAHSHGPWSFFPVERELHSQMPAWLAHWKGDGIIARIESNAMARRLKSCKCPIIDVLGQHKFKDIPSLDTDARIVARLAVDFFIQAGFQHFAYCGYAGVPFSDARGEMFQQFLSQQRRKTAIYATRLAEREPGDIQAREQQGLQLESSMADWLKNQPRPLALFACNDVCAQQVLNACRENNIRVPEEIAVMGVDNDDVLCNLCDPPLTSIEPNTEELGYRAAAMMDRLLNGERLSQETVLIPPVRIVERASTDMVAVDDKIAVTAMRFIRDQVGEGIAVKDVLLHTKRSRTDLDIRFRRWLGCSVRDQIQRQRLQTASQLLHDLNMSIQEVAERSGFADSAHFCRVFRREFQCTPTEYRQHLLK